MSKYEAFECDYCGDMVVNDRFTGKKLEGWGTTYDSDCHICKSCRDSEVYEFNDLNL